MAISRMYREPEEDASGWVQRITGSLNSPLDLRYLVIDANYRTSDYQSFEGITNSRVSVYTVDAFSKNIKYIRVTNKYSYADADFYERLSEVVNESNTTTIQTTGFKRTKVKGVMIYEDESNSVSGDVKYPDKEC